MTTAGTSDPHYPTSTGVDLGNDDINAQVAAGMVRVEKILTEKLSQGEDFITDKVQHLAFAGGKRFRPMFALLAARYGDHPESDDVIKAAVIVEMTHLATLYHDDVMDEAEKRRGVDSANTRWTNSVAILAGDYLLAQASHIMAELGVETVSHFADTFGELVTGQMRETVGPGDGDPVEHYRFVIREKTGVLIAAAGFLGALHGGASREHIDALWRLGYAVGMVFQIVDDIIDIFSDTTQSGKTPGTDLKEGVFTLPVLHALAEDTPVGEKLRSMLTGPLATDEEVKEVLGLLHESTGRQKALDDVATFVAEANEQLDRLPNNSTTAAIRQVIDFTVRRVG